MLDPFPHCDNRCQPQQYVVVDQSLGPLISAQMSNFKTHRPRHAQDSGLNLPRFCLMAWTLLLSSSNFLISSACSAFFLSRSWKR